MVENSVTVLKTGLKGDNFICLIWSLCHIVPSGATQQSFCCWRGCHSCLSVFKCTH